MKKRLVCLFNLAVFMCFLIILQPFPARATVVKHYTFEEMAKKADLIIKGKCEAKNTKWVDSHLETTLSVSISEILKGKYQTRVIEITQLGGSVNSPAPLRQYVPDQPHIYKGEDVVLFLTTDKTNIEPKSGELQPASTSNLIASPKIIGLWQGKFTILKNESSGEEYVTRFCLEQVGYVSDDTHSSLLHRELKSKLAKMQQLPSPSELAQEDWDTILNTCDSLNKADPSLNSSSGKMVKPQRMEQLTSSSTSTNVPMSIGQQKLEKDIPAFMNYKELKNKVSNALVTSKSQGVNLGGNDSSKISGK